jgi:hypothetical protein
MKTLFVVVLLLLVSSCVNNRWDFPPKQTQPDTYEYNHFEELDREDDLKTFTIIKYTF